MRLRRLRFQRRRHPLLLLAVGVNVLIKRTTLFECRLRVVQHRTKCTSCDSWAVRQRYARRRARRYVATKTATKHRVAHCLYESAH